jgi:hypothetical protein
MKTLTIILSSLLISTAAVATRNLQIVCSLTEEAERVYDTSTVTGNIQLPTDSSRQTPIKFEVYGGKVAVYAQLAPRKDNTLCEYKTALICLQSGYTDMCQENEVMFMPEGGQVGDRTTVNCTIRGDVSKSCEF